ncbi:ABC transporter ATP-binding protein [Ktedonosporobacter rubrisoli]|uniref:ABC transporter ATP-binding protein n=1 Tax=Ktedonosporobacter rubrisoli TaxID=2509675 RepID=A0A4P6JZV4_KTERU|nr:ABC transporter ATP-binding protein [Ktedonosporobacter rubrisoli]QBD81309.1 ABC transporter ATP-binding protein [Ktedonosporobacter rubrisoli]
MTSILRVDQVSKTFLRAQQRLAVLREVSVEIEQGTFVVIVGPSGCGKSTLLNLLAGLLAPESGTVWYQGQPVLAPSPSVGYLTQKETLMPWRSIESNIALPLEIRGVKKAERQRRVRELMETVGLQGWEKQYPRELSGGMLRRASLARMLVADPETLLLDEPFGALDAQLRLELQAELLRLWEQSGKSVLFVTHDLEEALALGDRVLVFAPQGQIVLDAQVSLERPRDVARIRFEPRFIALYQRLWEALVKARAQQEVTA